MGYSRRTERRGPRMELVWDLGKVDDDAQEFDVLGTKSY
jgi:hypothetical protein